MQSSGNVYTVRIHVRGNYLVGRYVSMTEAAIAYNKAVDILRENGFSKNYSVNYIEGLPSGKYAELYDRLQISARIRSCRP